MFVTPGYAQEHAPASGTTQGGDAHGAAEGAAHTEAAGDAHGKAGFPPFEPTYFPSQLLWLAITFGLFYLFLKKVVLPRIGGILEVRRDRIAHDLDTAARLKEDADAAIAAYEQELADARAKSNKIANDARDAAKAEADAERKEVEAQLNTRLADAETRISQVRASAMKDVGAIAEETATAIVQSLVGSADKAAVAAAVKSAE
ncbi:F0F1 ATP synthase subunit B [Mesorhizobium australicum]|uniref:ATP synthase subunit b n=1 Tax=Mesorhizobium australicum TaxID=536018 RepID=A0A1X7NV33_9HYPH|nr:F0F1 ATP synthase subunit B [Mesorhizobium australicum]SMH41135.1 F-type H+-transporting ATPase subunit b [Mesorhizobium australicum]